MAVRPISFSPDGTISIWHDERNHGGDVHIDLTRFGALPDGSENLRWLRVDCPVVGCESYSYHPITGGCDRRNVQELFVAKLRRSPSDHRLPYLPGAAERSRKDAIQAARALSDSLAPGNWAIDD